MEKQTKNWWAFHMITRTPVGNHTYGPACYTDATMGTFFGTDEEILHHLFETLPKRWKESAKEFPENLIIEDSTLEFLDKGYFEKDEAEGFIINLHCLIKTSLGNSKNWQWKSGQILKKFGTKVTTGN